jgi:hypothetical protein
VAVLQGIRRWVSDWLRRERDVKAAIDIDRKLDRILNDVDFIKQHMSAYLGSGVGISYLVDETPIYLATLDFGVSANLINGGRYEENHLQVLSSFLKPHSVFLDIGANLGVFTLRLSWALLVPGARDL